MPRRRVTLQFADDLAHAFDADWLDDLDREWQEGGRILIGGEALTVIEADRRETTLCDGPLVVWRLAVGAG